jgi:hypothetical protein
MRFAVLVVGVVVFVELSVVELVGVSTVVVVFAESEEFALLVPSLLQAATTMAREKETNFFILYLLGLEN